MERGAARILLATTTRRGSKLTLDPIAIEALGMKTGEARRVDLAAAWTGARGSMLTDEDARDIIIAGRACSCVRVRRHAVVGALHSGRAYRPACQQISERFEAAGNNRHLHIRPRGRPTHALRTMESPEKPPGKRQRKENAPEPPQEDPDFTHCCIYNVSHADLTVWLCGRGQKDPRDAIPDGLGFGFLDSKIDIGPNKDGVLMETKGGRMMLQRSLCRPKFSSQVRSPTTSQKNKQDLTTGAPAHDPSHAEESRRGPGDGLWSLP